MSTFTYKFVVHPLFCVSCIKCTDKLVLSLKRLFSSEDYFKQQTLLHVLSVLQHTKEPHAHRLLRERGNLCAGLE